MKSLVIGSMIAAMSITAIPATAIAQPRQAEREYRQDVREANREYRRDLRQADDRGDVRDARRDRRENVRDARQDRRQGYRDFNRYDYNRPDPRYGNRYDAQRYYRDGRYYQPRRLSANDRIYRGNNGRYYCRRNDGTTGLLLGALGGGVLGNVIANGRSETLGTLLGAGGGALLGRSIDRNNVQCR